MLMLSQNTCHCYDGATPLAKIAELDNIEVFLDVHNKLCLFCAPRYMHAPSPLVHHVVYNGSCDKILIYYPMHWPMAFLEPIVVWEKLYYDQYIKNHDVVSIKNNILDRREEYSVSTIFETDRIFAEKYPKWIGIISEYERWKLFYTSPQLPEGKKSIEMLVRRIGNFEQMKKKLE